MAKRFYNLEKETKEYLKACEAKSIVNQTNIKTLNDFVINRKTRNLNTTFLANSPIVLGGLVVWLDAGVSDSYPAGGTVWKDLAGSNNAVLINSVNYISDNKGAFTFNSGNDYIESSYTAGNISKLTMSAWLNKTNAQTSFPAVLVYSNPFGMEIYPQTIYINFTFGDYGAVNYNINGWQNIVFTFDGTLTGNSNRLKIYLNGINQTVSYTGTIPASVNITGKLQVGRRHWAVQQSQGSVSNVSIYNQVLTAPEILQNYNAMKGRFGL